MIFKNKILVALFLSLIILITATQYLTGIKADKKLTVIKMSFEECKPQERVCNVELDGLKLKVSFDKDVFYLKPFNISILLDYKSNNKINKKVESVYIDFKMKTMRMGVNRFLLIATDINKNKQSWQGKALLPVCVTGRAGWFSELEVIMDKKKYILTFPLLVKKAID